MTRDLLLDPGDLYGYAFGDAFTDASPFSGVFQLPKVVGSKKFVALEAWIIGLIKANEITDVGIEQPFLGKNQSFAAITAQAAYVVVAGMAAAKCNCNCYTIDIATWRSALGLPTQGPKTVLAHPDYAHFAAKKGGLQIAKRQWVKDRAFDYAVKHGANPKDDNEGDAICMWHWTAMRRRRAKDEASSRKDLFDDLTV
jgi:hypothetical protein